MPARTLIFEVHFRVEKDEGGYHAFCPNLKGLHTSGRTEKEAVENAKCAFEAYIESLLAHHDPIPLTMRVEESEEKTPAARPFSSLIEVAI